MRGPPLILFLAIVPALAGCVNNSAPAPSPTPYTFVDPMSEAPDHDHVDPLVHQLRSNVTMLGQLSLTEEEGDSAQIHSVDVCQNWAAVPRERAGQEGIDIIDISDPTNLKWVGKYRDPNAVGGDRSVAWSADCRFVFMGNEGSTKDTAGVRVIRAVDKANPKFESFYSPAPPLTLPPGVDCPDPPDPIQGRFCGLTGSVHTVYALKVGGVQYVYALNYGVHILSFQEVGGMGQLVPVGRYVHADPDALERANRNNPDLNATRRTLLGHDMTVYEQDGKVIMYFAYAYAGMIVIDITNPAAPAELGKWVPPGPGDPHYVHGVKSYQRADGRRITVVEAETFSNKDAALPSPFWVLDTSNLAQMRLLSTWTNPGGHGSDHLFYSTHFFNFDGDRLWLAHYHGGIWLIDLANPEAPVVDGYYMPAVDNVYRPLPNCCLGYKLAGTPMTFDVFVKDHVAYVADFSTGFYALRADLP